MCEDEKIRRNASESLASLVRRDLGVEMSARQLRLFILARWDRIKVLAHSIHDEIDQ